MSTPIAGRQTQIIPLALIDRPQLDARIDRDPEKLEELSRDILRRGLIEPIKVVRVGERYEVVDGFRRYLGTRNAGLEAIECFVFETRELAHEGLKYAANAYREDMSPAEEAVYFYELFNNECGHDIERVAALVGKKVPYVSGRMELLDGDELVFAALKNRQITIGVAQELNRIDAPDYRRYYLEHAKKSGATVATVAGWVQEYRTMYGDRPQQPAAPAAAAPASVPSSFDPHRCEICRKNDPRFIPEQISVHTHCKVAILEPLLAAYRGESDGQ